MTADIGNRMTRKITDLQCNLVCLSLGVYYDISICSFFHHLWKFQSVVFVQMNRVCLFEYLLEVPMYFLQKHTQAISQSTRTEPFGH